MARNTSIRRARRRPGFGTLLLLAGAGALGYYLRKPGNRQVARQKLDDLNVPQKASQLAGAASRSFQRVRSAVISDQDDVMSAAQNAGRELRGAAGDMISETKAATQDAPPGGHDTLQELKTALQEARRDLQK